MAENNPVVPPTTMNLGGSLSVGISVGPREFDLSVGVLDAKASGFPNPCYHAGVSESTTTSLGAPGTPIRLDVVFADKDNWSVSGGLPPIGSGNVKLTTFQIGLQAGNPPAAPATVVATPAPAIAPPVAPVPVPLPPVMPVAPTPG